MKKYILLLIAIVLASCATRKVDTQIEKKDSTVVTSTKEAAQANVDSTTNTVIVDNTVATEIEIIPIDSTKPLIVDGKTYSNAVIRYKKQANNIQTHQEAKVTKELKKATENYSKTNVKSKQKSKKIDSVKFPYWWILLVLIALASYYLYRNFKF